MNSRTTRRSSPLLISLIAAGILEALQPASAQETPVMTTVVVPVVGTVDGANGYRWKTDVELHNFQPAEATVALSLPTAPDEPGIITTIPGGQSVSLPDIVATFGLQTALSPLVVQTAGRQSIGITATAYGVRGTEISTPQPIAIEYAHGVNPQRLLAGLSFSDEFRTNVGIVNLGDRDAIFTLALQRVPGRNFAITHFAMRPNSIWHASIQSLFPLITNGNDFAIVVETSAPNTYVYASVIENETSVARFVQPVYGAMLIEKASIDR